MPLDFLTPRVERLRADGAFELVHEGGALGRLRAPVVLLARDLTAYALFETAALPRNRRRQAARLHARAASPYVSADVALVKAGGDFGVWWWDRERIAALLAARDGVTTQPLVRPETLAQPPGEGWRIVRLEPGYEAQLWRGGRLLASAWRRERYDAAAWSAFARLQRDAGDAPAAPPAPETLPVAFDGEAFSLARTEITREQALALAGGGFAFLMIAATLFLAGQGLRLSADSDQIEAEAAELRAATPAGALTAGLEANRRKLAAFREIEERTSPLSAAGAAIGILAIHDLEPLSLDASEGEGGAVGELSLALPYDAVKMASVLVAEFEESGFFYDVQPRTDAANQRLVIAMKTRAAAPPLTAGE